MPDQSIPSDWNLSKIGNILERLRRPVDVVSDEYYREIGIRSHGKGLFHKDARTGASLGNKRVFWIEPDCFVLNIVFAWEQAVAKTTNAEKGMIASHRFPMYKPVPGKLDLDYILYFFKTPYGKYLLNLGSPGGAGRNKTLGQKEFSKLRIPLPPYTEQQKIASILCTWDEAIATNEELISFLQTRKKGLMQRLLTGKDRLPGFDEEWQEEQIGLLLREVKRPITWENEATYNLISVRRNSGGLFLRERRKGTEIKTKKMNIALAGDFLISKMQIVHGASGLTTCEFDGMHISGSYIALVASNNNELDIRFFDWLSRTPFFYHQTYLSSYGVHIEKMTFNLRDFLKQKIRIPNSTDEQAKIVSILEAAESEIKLYQEKVEILKQQKKGLMQRLLTGQVRVKV